jgi:Rap1a immunity proteins
MGQGFVCKTALWAVVVLAAVLASLADARAENTVGGLRSTGDMLYTHCLSSNTYARGICLGYVEGVAEAGEQQALASASVSGGASTLGTWRWCIPTGAAAGQAREIVVKFLRENAAERHLAAASIVALALQHAWPCRP